MFCAMRTFSSHLSSSAYLDRAICPFGKRSQPQWQIFCMTGCCKYSVMTCASWSLTCTACWSIFRQQNIAIFDIYAAPYQDKLRWIIQWWHHGLESIDLTSADSLLSEVWKWIRGLSDFSGKISYCLFHCPLWGQDRRTNLESFGREMAGKVNTWLDEMNPVSPALVK